MADSHHDFSTISAAAADTKLVNCTGFASSLQADRQAVARADGGPDQKIKQPMLTPHRFKAPAPALAPAQAGMCAGRHAPACVVPSADCRLELELAAEAGRGGSLGLALHLVDKVRFASRPNAQHKAAVKEVCRPAGVGGEGAQPSAACNLGRCERIRQGWAEPCSNSRAGWQAVKHGGHGRACHGFGRPGQAGQGEPSDTHDLQAGRRAGGRAGRQADRQSRVGRGGKTEDRGRSQVRAGGQVDRHGASTTALRLRPRLPS